MAAAACSATSAGLGNWPAEKGRGNGYFWPKPNCVAASARAVLGSFAASCTKAVLHEMANAWWNGIWPGASPSKLVNGLPPMVTCGGQVVGVSGLVPLASSAAVVTTLNVEPGGYWPATARLNGSVSGWL